MYTNCCWAISSVSSFNVSSSIPQLNSSIKIFSQLPVCSVELTCSSSSFVFASLCQLSLLDHQSLCKALLPESLLNFPSTSSLLWFPQSHLLDDPFQAYFYFPTLQLFCSPLCHDLLIFCFLLHSRFHWL